MFTLRESWTELTGAIRYVLVTRKQSENNFFENELSGNLSSQASKAFVARPSMCIFTADSWSPISWNSSSKLLRLTALWWYQLCIIQTKVIFCLLAFMPLLLYPKPGRTPTFYCRAYVCKEYNLRRIQLLLFRFDGKSSTPYHILITFDSTGAKILCWGTGFLIYRGPGIRLPTSEAVHNDFLTPLLIHVWFNFWIFLL